MSILPAACVRRLVERVLLFLASAFAVGSLSCGSRGTAFDYPTVPGINDSSLSESLRARYRVDAARLSLRLRAAPAHRYFDLPVEVEPHLAETIYSALVRVRLLAAGAERDTVFDRYDIHSDCEPFVRRGFCFADTNLPAIRRWRDGLQPTGDPLLDSLAAACGLKVSSSTSLGGGNPLLWIRVDRLVNMPALCWRLKTVSGVELASASGSGAVGRGPDLAARIVDGAWELDWSVSWGDCIFGCLERRHYRFRVEGGRPPVFLGASGSTIDVVTDGFLRAAGSPDCERF